MTQQINHLQNTPKNVLLITRSFPPLTGSAVHRPTKFAKYLLRYNYQPFVLTATNFSDIQDAALLHDLPKGIAIQRVFSFEAEQLSLYIRKQFPHPSLLGLCLNLIYKLYSILYYRLIIPDIAAGWLPLAHPAAMEIVRRNNIELIYIHAPPFSSFLIGSLLKRRLPHIPLVLDYDDPWTTIKRYYPGNILQKAVVQSLEKNILTKADRIIYCKPTIYESIIKKWPELRRDKFHFIPNGFDPDDFSMRQIGGNKRRIRIVYTGKLRPYYCYSPISFFHALRALIDEGALDPDSLEVILAGLISEQYRQLIQSLHLDKTVQAIGHVSHREVKNLIASADILLFVMESEEGKEASTEFSGSIPAKIFEYIYAGKPILAIAPPGYEADLLAVTKTGFRAEPNNVDDIKNTLSHLYRRLSDNTLEFNPDWNEIRKYDRNILTGDLAAVFSGLL